MAEDGEDKLIAVARHIAKTLGRTETMTDDILQIFSTFDGRFSREKLSDRRRHDGGEGGGGSSSDEYQPPFPTSRTIDSVDHRISRLLSLGRPIWSDSADASAFLSAVDALLAALPDLDPADRALLDHAEDLLQRAALQLEDEFRALVEHPLDPARSSPLDDDSDDAEESDGENDRIPVAQPVSDLDIVIDALPSGTIADLHEIAKRMVAAGFGKELAHAYSVSRRDFLDESVSRLGLRARAVEEVQATSWTDLEDEIMRWTKAVAVAARVLFPSERRLCDRVFAGLGPAADLAFAEACRGVAHQLLGFADAVAVGSRAPERLFRVVDMYEALRDALPEIDAVFVDQYSSFLRSDAAAIFKGLGAAIRGIFMELENLIRRDPAKAAVPGGGLHPITRYVMNYLRAACVSRRTLEEVMEEESSGAGAAAPTADPDRPSSSLGVQIAWIMEVLQGNLETKAKIYKDPALSCVFLMNNGRYIIQKVKDNELGMLLGEDWIRRQMARVRRCHMDYQRGTWAKVIAVLRTGDENGAAASRAARERFRMFNTYLDEIVATQRWWVVADEQFREHVRDSAVELVLPMYRRFMGRFRGPELSHYPKYSAEDVEERIRELFQGGNSGRR